MSVRPLHPLKGNQRRASDPARHVWLSASAGTGKTQVLAARVWRLLLADMDPGAILCLTFTKAGAAEMSEQITSRLARWVRASDKELVADLEALGESISPEGRARARTLFAKVLDAPGGGSASRRSTASASRCFRPSRSRLGWFRASVRSTSARKRCSRARRWPKC